MRDTSYNRSTALVPYTPFEVVPWIGEGYVTIVFCPHPFSAMKEIHRVRCFGNIPSLMQDIGCTFRSVEAYHVCVDGDPIPQEKWVAVFPVPEQLVTIRCLPQFGGGNKGGKGSLGYILAGLAVVAAVFLPAVGVGLAAGATLSTSLGVAGAAIAASPLAYSLVTLGVGLIAQGILGLIFPPPNVRLPEFSQPGRVSQLTGIRNRGNPYGTIPRVFGKHRIFPPFAAIPYTIIEGDTQYLVCLFCLGYGPLTLSEFKIGDTDLDRFEDVRYIVHEAHSGDTYDFSIYQSDVFEESVNIELSGFSVEVDNSYTTRTTTIETTRISLDIYYPQGIIYTDDQGTINDHTMGVYIWYREVGSSTWLLFGNGPRERTASTRTLVRDSISWAVKEGQYEVAVGRSLPTRDLEADSANRVLYADKIVWTVLRSFKDSAPIRTTKDLVMIEIQLKATDQLNGVLDEFNCVAESHLQVFDGNSWLTQPTQNPAWAYVSALVDEANARRLGTTRIDATRIKAWADWCDEHGFYYNKVQDSRNTVFEQLREIASAGRGAFHNLDGLFSIVREIPQTTPIQFFTPRNSFGYKGEKSFVKDRPHALRIPFINETRGYTDDERTVYDDGYDVNNATLFETIPLPGVTHPNQVWRLGRYFIAQARLRPELHYISTDLEHLTCTRGDLVEFTQDAINLGVGSARIKSLDFSGSDMTGIVVDTKFPLANNTDYGVIIRRTTDGRRIAENVEVPDVVPETDTLTFTVPIGTLSERPGIGDLVQFGERESIAGRFIVRSIEHGSELTATIGLVQEAPVLQQVDIDMIPPWDPQISELSIRSRLRPPIPEIVLIQSDESVLLRDTDGSLTVRMVVHLRIATFDHSDALFYQVRYRPNGPRELWTVLPYVSIETGEVSIPSVQERRTYQISVRSITEVGLSSEWSEVVLHNVIGKLTPPPDVEDLAVARQSDGTRIFTWTLSNPPLDLAGYQIKYLQQGAVSRVLYYQYRLRTVGGNYGSWTIIPSSSVGEVNSGRYVVPNLRANQAYEFQLRAALYNNEFSAPIGPIEVTPSARTGVPPPATPTNLRASGVTDTLITLNWARAPRATSYEVKGGTVSDWTDIGNDVSYQFTGLTASTSYTLEVRSKNTGGTSTATSLDTATIATPNQLPGPVRNLAESTKTHTTITWTWSAPNTGGAATSYEYRTGPGTTSPGGLWTTTGTTTSIQITGLSASTQYFIEVRSRNGQGPSAVVREDVATTNAAPLGGITAPTIVVGTVSATSIAISWTDVGAGHTYEVAIGTPISYQSTGNSGRDVSHTFTGLDASTSYQINLRTTRASDNASVVSTPVTRSTIAASTGPGLPQNVKLNGLSADWDAPTTGGTVVRYEYVFLRGARQLTGTTTSTSVSITGNEALDRLQGTPTTFIVEAVGSGGSQGNYVTASALFACIAGNFSSLSIVNTESVRTSSNVGRFNNVVISAAAFESRFYIVNRFEVEAVNRDVDYLYTISPDEPALRTLIGALPMTGSLLCLGAHGSKLYALALNGTTVELWDIDPGTTTPSTTLGTAVAGTKVGDLPALARNFGGIASLGGTLYAVDNNRDSLWTIDATTPGSSSEVGALNGAISRPSSLEAFQGALYLVEGRTRAIELWRVNVTTPSSSTSVGSFSGLTGTGVSALVTF